MRMTVLVAKAMFLMGTFLPVAAGATDYLSTNSGDWFSPTTWTPSPYPYDGDNATISNNTVSLTFYNELELDLNDLNFINGGLQIGNTFAGLGSVTMSGANSFWTNGVLASDDYPVTVTQSGTLRLAGTNSIALENIGSEYASFVNEGTISQTDDGELNLTAGAVVNSSVGIYQFVGDGSLGGSGIGGGIFVNEGTILKSSGVNTSSINGAFDNLGGVIEVDSGTLTLGISSRPPTVSSNGTFIVGAGATLDLTGGGDTYWSGEITGSGAGQVVIQSGELSVWGRLTLGFPDGLFQWTGGAIDGPVTNLGVITLSGTGDVSAGLLINAGLFRHTNSASFSPDPFENLASGTYDAEGAGSCLGYPEHFDNFGLFRKTGMGTFMMQSYFTNYGGTIEVDSGTIEFSSFLQTNGVTRLAGGSLDTSSFEGFDFTGGVLTGAGSVTGTVMNAASVIPGNGGLGALQIAGAYTQTTNGSLDIALGGTATGEFGQLIVDGKASLAGELNLFPTNDFTLAIGDQFQIVSNTSQSGKFALPPTFPTGMEIAYSNNGVFLTVTGAVIWPTQLIPPTIGNGDFNFTFQTVQGQSYVVQTNEDLTGTNWGDFTNVIGDGSLAQFALPATNAPALFFRLREP